MKPWVASNGLAARRMAETASRGRARGGGRVARRRRRGRVDRVHGRTLRVRRAGRRSRGRGGVRGPGRGVARSGRGVAGAGGRGGGVGGRGRRRRRGGRRRIFGDCDDAAERTDGERARTTGPSLPWPASRPPCGALVVCPPTCPCPGSRPVRPPVLVAMSASTTGVALTDRRPARAQPAARVPRHTLCVEDRASRRCAARPPPTFTSAVATAQCCPRGRERQWGRRPAEQGQSPRRPARPMRWSLPVAPFGISSTKTICCGTLNAASCAPR